MKNQLKATITFIFKDGGETEVNLVTGNIPFSCILEQMNAAVSKFTNDFVEKLHEEAGKELSQDEFEEAFTKKLNDDAKILRDRLKPKMIIHN